MKNKSNEWIKCEKYVNLLQAKLAERFPEHKFEVKLILDRNNSAPYYHVFIDGKTTNIRYGPELTFDTNGQVLGKSPSDIETKIIDVIMGKVFDNLRNAKVHEQNLISELTKNCPYKNQKRFVVRALDKENRSIFPSFCVKGITNPFYIKIVDGLPHQLEFIEINCFSPVVPSIEQCLWEYVNAYRERYIKLLVQHLGPVGEIVSEVEIIGSISEISQSELSYNNENDPLITKIIVKVNTIDLLY
jgi:hypothetical protein